MWQAAEEQLDAKSLKLRISVSGRHLAYHEAVDRWHNDEAFREFFIGLLRDAPFDAYRWETPPVTSATLDRQFEFVLLDCPSLARRPDEQSFAEYFQTAAPGESVVTFENVGRDATLVVPCPTGKAGQGRGPYVHLASYVREADDVQVHEFWRKVGQAMRERVNEKPTWLSTAGMGVAWLHVRLDQRPKYYAHRPYRCEM